MLDYIDETNKKLQIMLSIFALYKYKPDVELAKKDFAKFVVVANAISFNRYQLILNSKSIVALEKAYVKYRKNDTDMLCDLSHLSVSDLESIMASIETYKNNSFTTSGYKPKNSKWWRANLESIVGDESITLNPQMYDEDFWSQLDWHFEHMVR